MISPESSIGVFHTEATYPDLIFHLINHCDINNLILIKMSWDHFMNISCEGTDKFLK